MKSFLDKEFMLETEVAEHLYHDYAEPLPLVDYHCHISPKEIWEDRRFHDLTEIWLGGRQPDGTYFGDHYKWRLMRSNGVSEDFVTGDQDPYQRYLKFVGALEKAFGNPMYHWCHLELRRFFGYDGVLNTDTAKTVWDLCADKLRHDPTLTVRGILKRANVAMAGTTDDPTDTLEWHEKIAGDPSITCRVCPSFRPDKAIHIEKPGFAGYIVKLAASVGKKDLNSVEEVCAALDDRLTFFKKMGCRASDHGLDYAMYRPVSPEAANAAYQKALRGETLTVEEAEGYQTALNLHLARSYHRLGVVMQVHFNAVRNPNSRMLSQLGPDSGFDCMGSANCADALFGLLNDLDGTDELPKTILYSLNPNDDAVLDVMIGAFQGTGVPGKVQHGAAWWFNDHKAGMEKQMTSLANLGILGNFVGMLTDSRSFLSYPRHEYFRRILCNLVGTWVENGEYPADETALKSIVEGVCGKNAQRYFEL